MSSSWLIFDSESFLHKRATVLAWRLMYVNACLAERKSWEFPQKDGKKSINEETRLILF
jgi:hypothetical protein